MEEWLRVRNDWIGDGGMNIEWLVIRGSGVVAYGLLAASTVWGLLVATKLLGRAVKAKPLTWFHESLGLGALIATGVHVVALTMDEYIGFGWSDVLVPGVADWNSTAVALGVTGFYGLAIVALSFYVKGIIGQKVWRTIHFLAFGTFLSVTIHGVMAGTDTANPYVTGMYVGSSVLVAGLLTIRVLQQKASVKRTATPERVAARD
jgi:methionine sulfoxide reductase heme-binding subunit